MQDQISWASDTNFHFISRADFTVQVRGHNMSQRWVADQLMGHPAVKQASVRPIIKVKPSRLKAFVGLIAPELTQQRVELEAWAIEQLPWYAALGTISYGAELPRNSLGKASDWPD